MGRTLRATRLAAPHSLLHPRRKDLPHHGTTGTTSDTGGRVCFARTPLDFSVGKFACLDDGCGAEHLILARDRYQS